VTKRELNSQEKVKVVVAEPLSATKKKIELFSFMDSPKMKNQT
jgi:hypothetical protein